VLELADNGQLYSKLIKKGRFDEAFTKSVVQDLMSALEYLHSRDPPIIHRDIKPENILLDKDDRVKLAGTDKGYLRFWLVELLQQTKDHLLWHL
jgi:serine/threonine protein kinase